MLEITKKIHQDPSALTLDRDGIKSQQECRHSIITKGMSNRRSIITKGTSIRSSILTKKETQKRTPSIYIQILRHLMLERIKLNYQGNEVHYHGKKRASCSIERYSDSDGTSGDNEENQTRKQSIMEC